LPLTELENCSNPSKMLQVFFRLNKIENFGHFELVTKLFDFLDLNIIISMLEVVITAQDYHVQCLV